MAWKCNNCGNNSFVRRIIIGYREEHFDKNGKIEDDEIIGANYNNLECSNCSNEGNSINDIAYWYPEKEMEE